MVKGDHDFCKRDESEALSVMLEQLAWLHI